MKKLKNPHILILIAGVVMFITMVSQMDPLDSTATAYTADVQELMYLQTEPLAVEPKPPYNPETHKNGYCEGECWEGTCPYFEGYEGAVAVEPILLAYEEPPAEPEPSYTVQTMRIYHYCACSYCTPGTGITASGKKIAVGMVAMHGVPFGTVVEINSVQYVVEDRGVGPGKVDVYVESHAEALQRGTYMADVKIY